ncbi:hypothetical protein D3C85_637430 [compost metagenome]
MRPASITSGCSTGRRMAASSSCSALYSASLSVSSLRATRLVRLWMIALVASTPTSAVSRRVSNSSSRSSSMAFLPRNRLAMPSPRLALVLARPARRRAKKPTSAATGAGGAADSGAVGSGAAGAGTGDSRAAAAASGSTTGCGAGSGSGSSAMTDGATTAGACGSACTAAGAAAATGSATPSGVSDAAADTGSAAAACSSTCAGPFLRNQPNRPFFSPLSGVFLSSLEPNMDGLHLKWAAAHRRGRQEIGWVS